MDTVERLKVERQTLFLRSVREGVIHEFPDSGRHSSNVRLWSEEHEGLNAAAPTVFPDFSGPGWDRKGCKDAIERKGMGQCPGVVFHDPRYLVLAREVSTVLQIEDRAQGVCVSEESGGHGTGNEDRIRLSQRHVGIAGEERNREDSEEAGVCHARDLVEPPVTVLNPDALRPETCDLLDVGNLFL